MDKLPEDVTNGDFLSWVGELTVHLEVSQGWAGVSSLLRLVRTQRGEITSDLLDQLVDDADTPETDFDCNQFQAADRDKELYA